MATPRSGWLQYNGLQMIAYFTTVFVAAPLAMITGLLQHMHHDNSILAYEMNGKPLPEFHGAPLRVRNELELGFKQVKWLQAVEFVENFKRTGFGEGGFNEDNEYYGYRALFDPCDQREPAGHPPTAPDLEWTRQETSSQSAQAR
jgi:DMSO/TMAO reductase YedYZ molybdopterin-dependent catalytic subunit